MTRPMLLSAAGLLALALAACQSDLAKKELKAEAAVCQNLGAVATALDGVAALSPSSTVAEAQQAERNLATALTDLNRSESKLESVRLKAFRDQLQTFRGEVQRVSRESDLTLKEAGTALKAKATPLIEARRQLSAAVQCEEAPSKP
jgi:hypothetical protein